jgi:hypothetical protein
MPSLKASAIGDSLWRIGNGLYPNYIAYFLSS